MTTKPNNEIPLVEATNDAWLAALKGGARTANAATRAHIDREAAASADAVAKHAAELVTKLNEAIERLHAARTPKEARSAVAWLRCDTWARMNESMARLDALASVLD